MTSSPPDRTLHCYRHDQAYVGQCERCLTVSLMKFGRKLSVEQVHAELRRLRRDPSVGSPGPAYEALIDQLPRVDVVEECIHAAYEKLGESTCSPINKSQKMYALAIIQKYMELKGLSADPDLEEK